MKGSKKMFKKIAIVLSCLLLVMSVSGCGPKDSKTSADGKLSYWVKLNPNIAMDYSNYGDTPYGKALQEQSGTEIEFIHPSGSGILESLNILLASGDLPDIIEYTWFNYAGGLGKLYQEGLIVDLTDRLAKDAPAYNKYLKEHEDVKDMIKSNDKILGFMAIAEDKAMATTAGLIIREDWLEDLGLEMPETMDEYYNVLKAFKEEKGAKVPLSANIISLSTWGAFCGAYGTSMAHFVDNGKVVYGPQLPQFKEYLKEMNKWYSEKLLDNNFATIDQSTIDSNILNGFSGLSGGAAGSGIGVYNATAKSNGSNARFVGSPYPVLNKGDKPMFGHFNSVVSGTGAVISKNSNNIDAAIKFLDWGYTDEGYVLHNFGVEGVSHTVVDGKYIYTEDITNNKEGLSMPQSMGRHLRAANAGPFIQSLGYMEQYYATEEQQKSWKTWSNTDASVHALPNLTIPEDDLLELSTLQGDMDTYSIEMINSFIMGTTDIEYFDTFVKNLEQMGADRITEIYQNAYDAQFAK